MISRISKNGVHMSGPKNGDHEKWGTWWSNYRWAPGGYMDPSVRTTVPKTQNFRRFIKRKNVFCRSDLSNSGGSLLHVSTANSVVKIGANPEPKSVVENGRKNGRLRLAWCFQRRKMGQKCTAPKMRKITQISIRGVIWCARPSPYFAFFVSFFMLRCEKVDLWLDLHGHNMSQ